MMENATVKYVYKFIDWDEFVNWLKLMGFKRYEYAMPCRRGYLKDDIDIRVPYYSDQKNAIIKRNVDTIPRYDYSLDGLVLLEFFEPNDIPQDILSSWAK